MQRIILLGLLLISTLCIHVEAQTLPRSPSLQLDPAANWQFGAPPQQPVLEQFFTSRNCELWLLSWFIYDSKAGQRLSAAKVRQQFPQLADLPLTDCGYHITPAELEQALFIKLPPTPGLVLVYLDFFDDQSLANFVKPEKIATHQQRLNKLSQIKNLPKYFILTPGNSKPQSM